MSNPLPWRVECRGVSAAWEVIAGFNVERPALIYANRCADANPYADYRVTKRGKEVGGTYSPRKVAL